MKKIFFPLIALLMCILMLSGCVAKKTVDISDGGAEAAPSGAEPAASAEPSDEPLGAVSDEQTDDDILERMAGFWKGTGTPENGGSPIDLEVTVTGDGTGVYKFEQADYTESYPFTLELEDSTFTVDIPQNNQLGISKCSGTYELIGDDLVLHIKTEFTSGRSYEYTAVCARAQANEEQIAGENLFPWRGHTMCAKYVLDDGSAANGAEKPNGRYISICLECADGTIAWHDIKAGFQDFSLMDASGNEYTAVSSGFTIKEGQSHTIDALDTNEYTQTLPVFDIPQELSLNDLTLFVKTDADDVKIRILLEDIPQQKPEESTAPASDVDIAAAAEYVRQNESIDGMKPGDKTSDIENRLGPKDDFPAIIMENMQMYYFGQGYIFCYLNSSKIVTTVTAMPPSTGKTARGIGIGSTPLQVREAYADGINEELSTENKIVYGDSSAQIEFIFENGFVNLINLSY